MSAPEELFSLIRGRRSVRKFLKEPVERGTVERLVEWATWAPSAGNRQDWHFTVVTSPEVLGRMNEAIRRSWDAVLSEAGGKGAVADAVRYVSRHSGVLGAPALVVVSTREVDALQRRLFPGNAEVAVGGVISAAMAAQNLMLAAHAEGLGSCCMTGPLVAAKELKEISGLGPRQQVVCVIALGRPDEAPAAPPRKPVSEVATFVP